MIISRFDLNKAKELRSQGLTLQEVAEVMGCSLAWANKNLTGVPKGNQRVAVDDTKIKAIKLLEDALEQVRAL